MFLVSTLVLVSPHMLNGLGSLRAAKLEISDHDGDYGEHGGDDSEDDGDDDFGA